MADDEGGFSWDEVEAIEEPQPEGEAEASAEAGEGGAAPAEGAAKEEVVKPRYVPQKDSEIQALHFPKYPKRDCKKPREFHHWVRPTRLQYRYNYDYAHNYYDDVIHFLNAKSKGEPIKELPRSQTWAERALRTYTKGLTESAAYEKMKYDHDLLEKIKYSGKFYADHSKEFYNRKYRDVLNAYITHW